ncbi:MAG: hypothetical protein IJ723_04805 [Ruminococcus sp.]|nr:hypothetical protein [Ruminococcus sp.]
MKRSKRKFTIGHKMYLFISFIVLIAVIGTAAICYNSSVHQIDDFY